MGVNVHQILSVCVSELELSLNDFHVSRTRKFGISKVPEILEGIFGDSA